MKKSIGNKTLAFLCHPYHRGGVTRWMADGAIEAIKSGFIVYFVTVKPKYPFYSAGIQPSMVDLLKEESLISVVAPEVGFEFEFGTQNYRSWVYKNSILKFLPEGTPIIVSDDPAVWDAAASVSKIYPMIAVLHSDDPAYFNLASKYYPSVNSFIAVSHRIANKCKAMPTLTNRQVIVIPCGIPIREQENIKINKKERIRLIWIGRVEERQKRISDLIKIVLELKEVIPLFTLDIVGDGPEFAWMQIQIKENGIQDLVVLHGWKSSLDISAMLNQADLLILPSNYEGMPVAMMEAFANGCAVVSSRVSGVEDYENLTQSKNCLWVYEIGQIDQAVNCILKAIQTPDEIRRIAALNFAKKEFSIKNCIEKYYVVINENTKAFKPELSDYPKISIFPLIKSYCLSIIRYLKIKYNK